MEMVLSTKHTLCHINLVCLLNNMSLEKIHIVLLSEAKARKKMIYFLNCPCKTPNSNANLTNQAVFDCACQCSKGQCRKIKDFRSPAFTLSSLL